MSLWKNIIEKLFIYHCFMCGDISKLTSKKVAQFLLGRRERMEIFKLYEMRYLLLKTYPLIHTFFQHSRETLEVKFKNIWMPTKEPLYPPIILSKDEQLTPRRIWPFKQRSSFVSKRKTIPPQILFATITPLFAPIIHEAAQICNMPWHQNRWLSGSITAAISYPADKLVWQYLQDSTQENIFQKISDAWGANKENNERTKERTKYYNRSRWPSLLIIPDLANNAMILKEAKKVGLPIMGLVNSKCNFEIEYPIFAQDQTLQSIHFFCHFLAVLIAKEAIFTQHKRHTLQKTIWKTDKKKILTPQKKESPKSEKKKLMFEQNQISQQLEFHWKKPFFFKIIRRWNRKISKRKFFSRDWREHIFKAYQQKPHYLTFDEHYLAAKKKNKPLWKYRVLTDWFQRVQKKILKSKNKKMKLAKTKTQRKKQKIKRIKVWRKQTKPLPKFFKTRNIFFLMVKTFFKQFENSLTYTWKKQINLPVDTKTIHKENRQKYFQKNRYSSKNIRQIYLILRNFLWLPHLRFQLLNLRYPHLHLFYFYRLPAKYYGLSLQQWHQESKWQNRKLSQPLFRLNSYRNLKITPVKTHFFKKAYNTFGQKKTPRTTKPWSAWVKKNRKISPRNNYQFLNSTTVAKS